MPRSLDSPLHPSIFLLLFSHHLPPAHVMQCPQDRHQVSWFDWLLLVDFEDDCPLCGTPATEWKSRWLRWHSTKCWWKPWTWHHGFWLTALPPSDVRGSKHFAKIS